MYTHSGTNHVSVPSATTTSCPKNCNRHHECCFIMQGMHKVHQGQSHALASKKRYDSTMQKRDPPRLSCKILAHAGGMLSTSRSPLQATATQQDVPTHSHTTTAAVHGLCTCNKLAPYTRFLWVVLGSTPLEESKPTHHELKGNITRPHDT